MNQKAKYLALKAIRLMLLFAGLAAIVLVGNSLFTGNAHIQKQDRKPAEAINPSTDRVNINTASLNQLMDLPTIGQVIGSRIIEYRQLNGPFKRTSDIIIIKGISEHKFRQLEELITVE